MAWVPPAPLALPLSVYLTPPNLGITSRVLISVAALPHAQDWPSCSLKVSQTEEGLERALLS